jgi:hypothetical protein
MLDRPPILPPRWASDGSAVSRIGTQVAAMRAGRRRARRSAALMLAVGFVAAGARLAFVPDALGAPRETSDPGPTGAVPNMANPAPGFVAAATRLGLDPAPAPAVPTRSIPDPCPPVGARSTVRSLIACEATLWNVPGGASRALAVARCESRFERAAFNPTGCGGSGCVGLFQQSLRYWRRRAAEYGYPGRPATDARANVVVSMRMAEERGTWSRDWPVCGR